MSVSRHALNQGASLPASTPTEVAISVGHRMAQARKSRFQCHVLVGSVGQGHVLSPRSVEGWDVYIDGMWLMGGLVTDPFTGASRPRFPRVADAVIALMQYEAAGHWPAAPSGSSAASAREAVPAGSLWGLSLA